MTTLLYLLIIAIFVAIDWFFIEKKDIELDKRIMWSVRILVAAIFAIVVKDFHWMPSLRYLLFLGFYFYFFFDYSLNIARGKPFFHKGDNFFDKLIPAGIPDLGFTIIGLIGSYIVYQTDFFRCLTVGILETGFWHDVKVCMDLMI